MILEMSVKSSKTEIGRNIGRKKKINKKRNKRKIGEAKRQRTRKIPGLPFTDIDFANNADFFVISIDLGAEVEVDEFFIGGSKSEAQGEGTEG